MVFKRLVAEVGLGHVGLVMGLEVSRLARSSSDWHRLLEICALADTLILDEDGLYDPSHFNDRLLLGLKGTMSEAELHVLRARLIGGRLNKARRGELWIRAPPSVTFMTITIDWRWIRMSRSRGRADSCLRPFAGSVRPVKWWAIFVARVCYSHADFLGECEQGK